MSGVNKVIIIGNLGKKPELRRTTSGVPVASFSVATTESFTGKDGQKREETEWHNIVCWNKKAELAERYLDKGSKVYLEGKIKTRSWDDQNGQKRYATEIIVDQMQFLSSLNGGNHGRDQFLQPYQQQQLPQQPYQQPQQPVNNFGEPPVEVGQQQFPPQDTLPF